jgi:catechol 2,3-dioxygenase
MAAGDNVEEDLGSLVLGIDQVRDPEELESMGAPASAEIAPRTSPGPVRLSVADLERSLGYYTETVGLERTDGSEGWLSLGVGDRELLTLVEEQGAGPSFGFTGLYHFALLVPTRTDLARWLAHAARDRVPLVGLSDHFVSEAIYLADPDGHGIEIYCDRPREVWEGKVADEMTTLPLDVDDLLSELTDPAHEPFDALPPGTVMGHVHLKVAAIEDTISFYRDLLGFDLMAQLGASAAFLSAGGYHHHIGANTWESAGAASPPAGTAALQHATFVLPDESARDRVLARLEKSEVGWEEKPDGHKVRDPSGNAILLTVARALSVMMGARGRGRIQ